MNRMTWTSFQRRRWKRDTGCRPVAKDQRRPNVLVEAPQCGNEESGLGDVRRMNKVWTSLSNKGERKKRDG